MAKPFPSLPRRQLLRASALGVSAGFGAGIGGAGAQMPGRDIVLVHGAWHGGWCWRHVRRLLEAAGHRVFTPTLTGHGERSHLMSPAVNLTTHITDVVNLVEWEELDRPILVGHSYAGAVITGVCDRLRARLGPVIYLDAAVQPSGLSFIEDAEQAAGGRRAPPGDLIDGYLMPIPDVAWFGVPPEHGDADWLRRRLTLHSINTLNERLNLANGGADGLDVTFILCTGGSGTFIRHAERARAKGWTVRDLDSGHDAMITAPDALAAMIRAVA